MDTEQEEIFQIATLIVVVGTAIVCMCYFLIFLNPQIALNPLKPPLATPTLVAGLPATWTPTLTGTPTRTAIPTITPLPTDTPLPTSTTTRTRLPTRRPPTSTPLPPTLVPYTYAYRPVNVRCTHSGGTFVKGTVWNGGVPQTGVRIRLSWTPNGSAAAADQVTGYQAADQSTSYTFVLRGNGAYSAGSDWYVWVLDYNDQPASDPNMGHVRTNNLGPNDSNACWMAVVDFAR
jgi:hypothetical protein